VPGTRLIASTLGLAMMFSGVAAVAAEVLEIPVADGVRRVHVFPATSSEQRVSPLVLVFHGLGDRAGNFSREVAFHKDWPQATVAYPEGLPRADRRGMRGWQGFPGADDNGDLSLVDALLEILPRRYPIDRDRVYVTGFSNGAHMTFNLLRERPCRFAAFAPVGALAETLSGAMIPRPVLYLFGREEPREYTQAWQQSVIALAKLNGATGEKREWSPGLTEFVPGPGGRVTVYGLYNAGHVWPIRGNEWIAGFFQRFSLQDGCEAAR
jgi:poly(3-hydroxybutyrate) depolymerase